MKATAFCGISVCALMLGFLAGRPASDLPQASSGGDFLSVLLGDAKADISQAMLHEADSYFHGGIDMECHALDAGGNTAHHHEAGCSCGRHGHAHESETAHDAAVDGEHDALDPWRWVNSHIRAPEVERHLEGEKTVELMPWFWAAIKADPHNVEAWSTAWYVASRMMKDDRLALKIAEDGWRLNATSMELACVVGRACRAKGTLDARRSEEMFKTAFEMGLRKEKMTEKERFAFVESVVYLADFAKMRKDRSALILVLEQARSRLPSHPVLESIRKEIGFLDERSE